MSKIITLIAKIVVGISAILLPVRVILIFRVLFIVDYILMILVIPTIAVLCSFVCLVWVDYIKTKMITGLREQLDISAFNQDNGYTEKGWISDIPGSDMWWWFTIISECVLGGFTLFIMAPVLYGDFESYWPGFIGFCSVAWLVWNDHSNNKTIKNLNRQIEEADEEYAEMKRKAGNCLPE
ncbi:MAG: hypothetical protein FWB85_11125 [Chitinispirillia bacterium]|nr:hypothetical protein [Chitinispirillia bacterium]MCL2242699.1 hypothetical protein [Chitinispirillia bacterium]